uniref:PDZ domain-containing protein n=1 Tax=Salarias fasciatus TaxID=181472 RepID=A0A672I1Y1_SALFA
MTPAGVSPHHKDLQMIELEKDPAAHGLGISLTGNKDGSRARMSVNDTGIFVSDIIRGGVADSDGRLLLGDQILSINGEDVRAASQEHAKTLLQVRDVAASARRLSSFVPGLLLSCTFLTSVLCEPRSTLSCVLSRAKTLTVQR